MIFELTSTGVKASYPDTCVKPRVEMPGISGEYEAQQFHIHSSSEHTIDGNHFGAELHTVHTEVGGDRYAVVGMMIQPDGEEDNEFFGEILTGWQELLDSNLDLCEISASAARQGGERRKLTETNSSNANLSNEIFSPYMLIPEGSAYYHYDGGLTTPPCSEVVWWNIADKPISLDPAQFHQLIEEIIKFVNADCHAGTFAGPAGLTARPTVALNGRTVDRVCPIGFEEELDDDAAATFSLSTLVGAAFVGAAVLF
jgi:carbonic anhydrase